LKGCPIKKLINLTSIFTIYEETFVNDYYFPGESHDFWEFVCVVDGVLGVTAGTDVFILEHGQAVLHKPMEFHRLWSEKKTRPHIIVLSFAVDRMPAVKEKLFRLTEEEVKTIQTLSAQTDLIFERQNNILIQGVRPEKEYEQHLFVDAFERVLLQMIKESGEAIQPVSSTSAKHYKTIVTQLEQAVNEQLTLEELAVRCHMSSASVKKIFTKYAGTGVMTYFNELKIKRAVQLLHEGKTIGQTASLLGFSDQNYFSTVFKRVMKMSPSAYQKQCK
jgi:AraC-like DNA-binding protein